MLLARLQREIDQPEADRGVAGPVNDDEASKIAVVGIGGERQFLIKADIAHADLVEFQGLCGGVLQRVDVDLVFGLRELGRHRACAQLDQVGPARQHRLITHPQYLGFKLVGNLHRRIGGANHIAAAGVYLVGKRQHDGLA